MMAVLMAESWAVLKADCLAERTAVKRVEEKVVQMAFHWVALKAV